MLRGKKITHTHLQKKAQKNRKQKNHTHRPVVGHTPARAAPAARVIVVTRTSSEVSVLLSLALLHKNSTRFYYRKVSALLDFTPQKSAPYLILLHKVTTTQKVFYYT